VEPLEILRLIKQIRFAAPTHSICHSVKVPAINL
jgi:hypothetical protein